MPASTEKVWRGPGGNATGSDIPMTVRRLRLGTCFEFGFASSANHAIPVVSTLQIVAPSRTSSPWDPSGRDGPAHILRLGTHWESHLPENQFRGRREDVRLVTGRGRYTADYDIKGQVAGHFLRADRAHAKILRVDTEQARRLPGVLAIVTAADAVVRFVLSR